MADTVAEAPAVHHALKSHHRDVQGGAARAAVFGISDGLLTNVSLILGVAGGSTAASIVRLAGLAGLISGAFSMAAGEYLSMTAQKELFERELEIERRELQRHPEAETRELASTFQRRGLSEEDALRVAQAVMRDPEVALVVHAQEELGVSPHRTGRPWQAAASSFVSFGVGAIIPLFPWFFTGGRLGVILSIILGAAGAVAVGLTIAAFTGRIRFRPPARQLVFAIVAAGVTYGVGRIIGVSAGG